MKRILKKKMEIIIRQVEYDQEKLYQIIINDIACSPITYDMLLPEIAVLFGERKAKKKNSKKKEGRRL